MDWFIDTPYFGILISIVMFEIGLYINKKTKIPVLHPLLISIGLIIGILLAFDISLETYEKGGNMISFFLGPVTVTLAVPLYKKIDLLKKHTKPILIGIIVGVFTSILSVVGLTKLFGYEDEMIYSLIPKSITTPIGIEVSESIGGIPSITVVSIIVTGIIGAIVAPFVCKIFRIEDKVAKGIAIGTSSHAVGTSKAMEMGETEGAMSGLAIGLAGLLTAVIVPILLIVLD
ncbi:LrgB family protein [Clostridium sp. D2Q-11]|uniref:LrgB family protein n=1 Tax=Anaeromonas frigoriresistens TaxID=2683708 RepID=A0A942Z704_9FIRM|nr:LrgB family protein [Anaeromonas frigoriresistens]MBS4539031.1 LrgB family protein [Anaeromonas frigoriresistens]